MKQTVGLDEGVADHERVGGGGESEHGDGALGTVRFDGGRVGDELDHTGAKGLGTLGGGALRLENAVDLEVRVAEAHLLAAAGCTLVGGH